jgi:poly(3-hydroxybutyrate) depolymerase
MAYGAARDPFSAFAAMQAGGSPGPAVALPLIVFHGDRDRTIAPVNADQLIASRVAAAGLGTADAAAMREPATTHGGGNGGHRYSRRVYRDADGAVVAEQWMVHGGAHAWFGGGPTGTHTDPQGPDASTEMLRFFLNHPAPIANR